MDYRSSRILRRPRRLQRIQTRSNPDGLARRIPGPPRLANPTFGTQAESNKIWHNLFAVGRPHHEEHPFPPSLRILHPAELSFTGSDAATTAQQTQRPPDGGTREVLVSILIPTLPNAPFTATVNTEWIRQLPDRSTITLQNHRPIARDAAGRIFQERRALIPDDGKTQSGITQIEISDPVTHDLYIFMPYGRTCQVEAGSPPAPLSYTPTGTAPPPRASPPQSQYLPNPPSVPLYTPA